jgi:hypothetical protein
MTIVRKSLSASALIAAVMAAASPSFAQRSEQNLGRTKAITECNAHNRPGVIISSWSTAHA